ncbi:mule transposase protein [Fusarium langsethiae]|uniref:Mule transposase protein n=1 Tax=Fusarium langsethiae TaxID=179993 RepID=A0A0N0DAZ5_FUSLA|nr:mule transposase protein [Fusarium langsethiae]GKU09481.1 unnamed protein product [Fusarium langsethiae]
MRLQENRKPVTRSDGSFPGTPPRKRRRQASPAWAQAPFDPEPYYGVNDDALYNLFATWPESYFTSLPRPHGSRGIDEPWWNLRQSQIFLDDSFWGGGARRLFTAAIPGPDELERRRLRRLSRVDEVDTNTRIAACFQTALNFARELAETDSLLFRELARCRGGPSLR